MEIGGGGKTNKVIEISMGLSGIGFPENDYMQIAKKLYGMNSKILCPASNGEFCKSD